MHAIVNLRSQTSRQVCIINTMLHNARMMKCSLVLTPVTCPRKHLRHPPMRTSFVPWHDSAQTRLLRSMAWLD